ncbi:MAG: hypothetical protein GDA46_07360 [Bdellovibrionales bacterium]|nr:hypothetical protein [Bdellovibrionales bacterium]
MAGVIITPEEEQLELEYAGIVTTPWVCSTFIRIILKKKKPSNHVEWDKR